MLTYLRLLPALCLSLLAVACTPKFINPMVTKETLVPQPALVGEWVCEKPGDGEPASFTAAASAKLKEAGLADVYELRVTFSPKKEAKDKPGATGHFLAGFVTLGDRLFANITSSPDLSDEPADAGSMLLQAVFIVARISITGDTLTYEELSDSWLDEQLKKSDAILEHAHTDGGGVLITAPGEKIRAFITDYAKDEKAWKPATVWKKKP